MLLHWESLPSLSSLERVVKLVIFLVISLAICQTFFSSCLEYLCRYFFIAERNVLGL